MNERLTDLLDRFAGRRVAVVGDLVADFFVYGEATRVSREAPVLIVEHERDQLSLGGAANAAHNVKALGGEPLVVGLVGADIYGEMLLAELQARGIDTRLTKRVAGRPTTTKQRIAASGLHTTYQQLVRVDRGSREPVSGPLEQELRAALVEAAGAAEAVVGSDYGYGMFSPALIGDLPAIAHAAGRQALVDSRYQMLSFKKADLLTPNEPEAAAACRCAIRHDDDVRYAADTALREADAGAVAVTRGKKGMFLRSRDGAGEFLPIYGSDQIADVTGAGDTVMAVFALAAACGGELALAGRLATVAAGLAVMKHGAAVVTPDEIRAALERNPWREP
jgi:rfaE bifunctional protein kinase chain/domain